jgi:hypothetical protein
LENNNVTGAAYNLGWRGKRLLKLLNLPKADLIVAKDLTCDYNTDKFPKREIQGTVLSVPQYKMPTDPEIRQVHDPKSGRPGCAPH